MGRKLALVLCAACYDAPLPGDPDYLDPEEMIRRVAWDDFTTTSMVALQGVVSADVVTVDRDAHFQVVGYDDEGVGHHYLITLGAFDDNGSLPTLTESPTPVVDGFAEHTRAFGVAKVPNPGDASGGTVLLVGGDQRAAPSNVLLPRLTIHRDTDTTEDFASVAFDTDVVGALETGQVLRAAARYGRDGFIAVGDKGLILRTIANAEGHHDPTAWEVVRPPWMCEDYPETDDPCVIDPPDPAPDLFDVIRLGTGNLIVGENGTAWLYRPVPVHHPSPSTWLTHGAWLRLDLDAPGDLHAATADHVTDMGVPGALSTASDWEDPHLETIAYALVVGEDGYVARFGLNFVEVDANTDGCGTTVCTPDTCTPWSCDAVEPMDLFEMADGTGAPWGSVGLNGVWSDERTRIVVGDAGNLWTYPKSAPIDAPHVGWWWDRSPAPSSVDFHGVASDHSAYLAVGTYHGGSDVGVAYVGATTVSSCTAIGDFQRSCTPGTAGCSGGPGFEPFLTFDIEHCLEDTDTPTAVSAKLVNHLKGGSVEVYPTSISHVGTTYTLTFSSDDLNDGTVMPIFIMNAEFDDTDLDTDRRQEEILIIPEGPSLPTEEGWPDSPNEDSDPPEVGPTCYPNAEQSNNSVVGPFLSLVYGHTNGTTLSIGEPRPIEPLTSGSKVIPAILWVDLLTGLDMLGNSRRALPDPVDRCSTWSEDLATYHDDPDGTDEWGSCSSPGGSWTCGEDTDASTGVETVVGGFGRNRNATNHAYIDDYEREKDGGEYLYSSMKHDFFGRCHHSPMAGEDWPDDNYTTDCCTEDSDGDTELEPANEFIDLYAPFRARVLHIGDPTTGTMPCDGDFISPVACSETDVDPSNDTDVEHSVQFLSQCGGLVSGDGDFPDSDEPACKVQNRRWVTYGSAEGGKFVRALGRTLLVWTPDPEDTPYDAGWKGTVVLAIDNIDLCTPYNEEVPSGSIIEAGTRFALFSKHQEMDVAIWVNDSHDRWRLMSYFDMLPDKLYQIYAAKFGFLPRPSGSTKDWRDFDPVITAEERARCLAAPTIDPLMTRPEVTNSGGLTLACSEQKGVLTGGSPPYTFTPTGSPASTPQPAVTCPVRVCTTDEGLADDELPMCAPKLELCQELMHGGCIVHTDMNAPSCVGSYCAEVACPMSHFLAPGLR